MIQLSDFCLDCEGCVIKRFCFSERYFLLGSLKNLLQLYFFSSSFLYSKLVEGIGFFHSHCKTLDREQSQYCVSLHSLVSHHLLGVPDDFWEEGGNGEVLALEALGLFVLCELTN